APNPASRDIIWVTSPLDGGTLMNIPLRKGMLVRHQSHIYQVTEFSERHTGKEKTTVHVALRDIRDGHPVDRTLDVLLPIQEVSQLLRKMQYLYARGAS